MAELMVTATARLMWRTNGKSLSASARFMAYRFGCFSWRPNLFQVQTVL